jgi:hypothetical protein
VGSDNGWLGGSGESWERGPYYVDGLVPLAYLLDDSQLIEKASRWVEWTLASQRPDGLFGPRKITTVNSEVDRDHDWWHLMIMLKAVIQYQEATGDDRVIPFLYRFFGYVRKTINELPLRGWARSRGAEMILCLLWLYRRRPEEWLLELAEGLAGQTLDWTHLLYEFPFWRKVEEWDWRSHVVNVAMGIKTPGVLYELTGETRGKEAVLRGLESLMTYHGQAHGMFSGDEWLSGTHPSQGVELCAVVEYMFSMEQLTRIFGLGKFGDILEKVAFNALPAAISADWTSHQYDQQVNQILCNVAKRNWSNNAEANLFGLEPNFGCCTANMHQGWPKFVSHLWMKDGRGGLAAVSYAPCNVRTRVGTGTNAEIEVGGEYPFRETVTMRIHLDRTERFDLALRIPEWCSSPCIRVNGEEISFPVRDGYARINREWKCGDDLQLSLPMQARMVPRGHAVNVERGPLVFVLPVRENWQLLRQRERFHDWEVYPASPWKYGLLAEQEFGVLTSEVPRQPFEASKSPVRLTAKGQLVRNWAMEGNNAGAPPIRPDTSGQPVLDLELVPYAGAKLRIGEFPLISCSAFSRDKT